jgi:hypothetical protein
MTNLSEIPSQIQGKDAGRLVTEIIQLAEREGWNPIASVKLGCVSCGAPVSLRSGGRFSSRFAFIHSDGRYGEMQELDKPVSCKKCNGDSFRVIVKPTTFKDWIRETLTRIKPSDQNPGVGFREDRTGTLIRDPRLRHTSTFEELWSIIGRYIDPLGDFNPDYQFDMIGTRYLDRKVCGLAHSNKNKRPEMLTTIIKDEDGHFWYSVESL